MSHWQFWESIAVTLIGLASIFNTINLMYTRKRLDRMQDAVNVVRHFENFRTVYGLDKPKDTDRVT